MNNQELANILWDCWNYSAGLKKSLFRWNVSHKSLKVLSGTDTSAIVQWGGSKYHVYHEYQSNAIIINRA